MTKIGPSDDVEPLGPFGAMKGREAGRPRDSLNGGAWLVTVRLTDNTPIGGPARSLVLSPGAASFIR
jgi:hypothetical protein